jgi:outer membrane protein W
MIGNPAMAGAAQGARDGWLGRVRVININPHASSSALNLDVDARAALGLDFSGVATDRLAPELMLAIREYDVTPGGA